MDSSIATDPRFKLLAVDLGWSLRELAGTCFFVWLACYERRSDRLSVRQANACAENERFSEAIVAAGLAHLVGETDIVFHGAAERIKFLKKQAERGRKGGAARGSRRQPNAKQTLSVKGSERSANSLAPDLSPALAPAQTDPPNPQGGSAGKRRTRKYEPTDAQRESVRVVISKLNERTNRSYSPDTAEHSDLIVALLRKYTEEDIRLVVWDRANRWAEDPKMEEFLRPSTLFGPKNFADYVVHARAARARQLEQQERAERPRPGAVLDALAQARAIGGE